MTNEHSTVVAEAEKTPKHVELRNALVAGLEKARERARALVALTDPAAIKTAAADLANRAAKAATMASVQLKELLDPHTKAVKALREDWAPIIEGFKDIEAQAKQIAAKVMRAELEEQAELRRRAEAAAEEAAARQLEAARASITETNPEKKAELELQAATAYEERKTAEAAIPSASDPIVARSESGGLSLGEKWTWEATNIELVPEQYTKRVVDDDAVEAAIKAGVREIPGLLLTRTDVGKRQPAARKAGTKR